MNTILEKEFITPFVFRMRVEAPEIARKRKAGQFIILRTCDAGERIPLTIADGSAEEWRSLRQEAIRAGTTPAELAQVPTVCGSLQEAIDSLKADHDFLTKGNVFSKDQIESYLDLKQVYLGEELEKHVITKSCVIFIPPNFIHAPLGLTPAWESR